MEWKPADIPALLAHLPEALSDLRRHEDALLVQAGRAGVLISAPAGVESHRIAGIGVLPKPEGDTPDISIEKAIEPLLERSAQNIGLLLHDYLSRLPTYHPHTSEGERLLAHWRHILDDQPRRLAVAQQSFWKSPESREFWKRQLARYRTEPDLSPEHFHVLWEDWQRAAAAEAALHPAQQGTMKARQWQDLVIRSRLHQESKAREMEWW